MIPDKILKQNKFIIHHIGIFILFACLYHIFRTEEDDKELETFEGALYFSIVNHFTVGFGDISPKSTLLKRLCMIHIILAFFFFTS